MPTEPQVDQAHRDDLKRWIVTVTNGAQQADIARRSGIKPAALSTLIKAGSAGPSQLAKLARAYGRSPVEVFRVAGWLTSDEAAGIIPQDSAARDSGEFDLLNLP